jgi:hypothetical protein
MTPRELDRLLQSSASAPAAGGQGRGAAVWRHIRRGWDPERIEWQRWLRRWWPWVVAVVLTVAGLTASLPHGKHEASSPPALVLFGESNAGKPSTP